MVKRATWAKLLRTTALPLAIASLAGSALAQDATPTPQPVSFTDAEGTTTTLTPSADGLTATVQDARGVTTEFDYDALGQLRSELAPERGLTEYRYDEQGRPDRMLRPEGLDTRIRYDEQNRVERQVWKQDGADKIVTRYGYDTCENGEKKLCRVTHNGHVTRYGYTPDGHLESVRVKLADEDAVETLKYKYNEDGSLDTMRYPSGLLVKYHYDDQGRPERLIGRYETGEDRERIVLAKNITYDPVTGAMTGYTHGNGVRTVIEYTALGQIERMIQKKDGTVLSRAVYDWREDGELRGIDRLDSSDSQRFDYDARGRLIFETRGDGSTASTATVGYSYDAVGNRLSRTEGTSERRYDYAPDANQLETIGNSALTYDARGNLREDRSGSRSFDYDPTNRMSAFYRNSELRAEYDYDADGRRIRKRLSRADSDGTRSVRFLYNTDGQLVSQTSRRDDRRAVKAKDVVWLGPIPLAQIERKLNRRGVTKRANALYLHPGHLGEPRTARDENGTIVWSWKGDAFGAKMGGQRAVDRDPDGDGKKTEVSLRFPGQYADRESGLFYNHNRDYDPRLGRYVQSDPIGLQGGANRYAYVYGNPVRLSDPDGLRAREGNEDYTPDIPEDEVISTGVRSGSGSIATGAGSGAHGTVNYNDLLRASFVSCNDGICVDAEGNRYFDDGREIIPIPQDEVITTGTRVTTPPPPPPPPPPITIHIGGYCTWGGCTAVGVRPRVPDAPVPLGQNGLEDLMVFNSGCLALFGGLATTAPAILPMLLTQKFLLERAGYDPSEFTFVFSLNVDRTTMATRGFGAGFSTGIFIRADLLEFGTFQTIENAIGIDYDLGVSALLVSSGDISGIGGIIEIGAGPLDFYSPLFSEAVRQGRPVAFGIGASISPMLGGINVSQLQFTRTDTCRLLPGG